jgi:hypothetical protein
MSGHRVEASRVVAVPPALAFERLMAAPQQEVFARRYAAFPAVREVVDAPDAWDTPGQSRTIVLADGGSLHLTITAVDPPHGFTYLLDDIRGTLRPFARSIDGAWTVAPEVDGSRIGWSWTLHPKSHSKASPARLTMTGLGRMWKGYAERALAELEKILTRQ